MTTIFQSAQEAMAYAKANPGVVIVRHPNNNTYCVKGGKNKNDSKNKSRFE